MGKSPSRNPGAGTRRRILRAGQRRRGLGGRYTLRPPGPRPTRRALSQPLAPAHRSPRPCSSPCAAGNQAGTTQRRELYLRVSVLRGPAAVAQVPSRRPAGNERLRGGAAPHVRGCGQRGWETGPLKGQVGAAGGLEMPPAVLQRRHPSAWKSLRNPFIHSALLCLSQSALVSRDLRTKVPLGPRHGLTLLQVARYCEAAVLAGCWPFLRQGRVNN